MTSSPHGPYKVGYTRATMATTEGCNPAMVSQSLKVVSVRIVLSTREHEVGIASNRGSACRGEYVPALYTPPVTPWELLYPKALC